MQGHRWRREQGFFRAMIMIHAGGICDTHSVDSWIPRPTERPLRRGLCMLLPQAYIELARAKVAVPSIYGVIVAIYRDGQHGQCYKLV